MKKTLIACAFSSLSAFCFANDDYTKTLSYVGVQAPSSAFIYANEGWSQPCANGAMYIDLTTVAGRAMWAEVLIAKATGAVIHWVNYTIASGNVCTASLIELN